MQNNSYTPNHKTQEARVPQQNCPKPVNSTPQKTVPRTNK